MSSSTSTTTAFDSTPTDPLLRLLQSLDDNDASLLRSALTSSCILDQSGLSVITGFPMPTITGHEAIEKALLTYGVGETMDTGHLAGNFRVMSVAQVKGGGEGEGEGRSAGKGEVVDGKVLQVTCYVIGSHYRKGEGVDVEKRGLMAGTRWKVEVIKEKDGEEEGWKIRKGELKVLWAEGDLSLFA